MSTHELTAGEAAARLGVKVGMLRRYALALEQVTGISLEVDPVRGRLYPPSAVELLEATRAYLLAHPGGSVEGAMRVVTGGSEGESALPARVPGTISPADLQTALEAALYQLNAPVLAALAEQQERGNALERQVASLQEEITALLGEVQAARSTVERVEVITRAALPAPVPAPIPAVNWLARLLGLGGVRKP